MLPPRIWAHNIILFCWSIKKNRYGDISAGTLDERCVALVVMIAVSHFQDKLVTTTTYRVKVHYYKSIPITKPTGHLFLYLGHGNNRVYFRSESSKFGALQRKNIGGDRSSQEPKCVRTDHLQNHGLLYAPISESKNSQRSRNPCGHAVCILQRGATRVVEGLCQIISIFPWRAWNRLCEGDSERFIEY